MRPGATDAEVLAAFQAYKRAPTLAARAFVDAVVAGDVDAISVACQQLDGASAWRLAMLRVARLPQVPEISRLYFREGWLSHGDSIRSDVNDDLVLTAGLRALLPAYAGPDLVLYRGDSAWNRQRRTYGLSWSASKVVADGFARFVRQFYKCPSGIISCADTAFSACA